MWDGWKLKPYRQWDNPPINWCRISYIHRIFLCRLSFCRTEDGKLLPGMPSGHVMPLGKKWDLEIVLVKRGVCVKFGDPKIISMAVLYTAIAKILSEMSMVARVMPIIRKDHWVAWSTLWFCLSETQASSHWNLKLWWLIGGHTTAVQRFASHCGNWDSCVINTGCKLPVPNGFETWSQPRIFSLGLFNWGGTI